MALRREKKRIGDMLINENVITQEQLEQDRKSTRLNSSHDRQSRMPSSA